MHDDPRRERPRLKGADHRPAVGQAHSRAGAGRRTAQVSVAPLAPATASARRAPAHHDPVADTHVLERFCTDFTYEPMVFDALDADGVPVYHTNVIATIGTEVALFALEMIPDARRRQEVRERLAVNGRRIVELTEDIRSPYPKGLLIGTIADVQRSPDQLFQTALVAPAANFDTLEYVLVITDYEGGLPPISPEPSPTP